jgi:ribosome-associated toxin RatA of RatAB toxin-antitoxin module
MKTFVLLAFFLKLCFAQEIITLNKETGTGSISFQVEKNKEILMREILKLKAYPQKIDNVAKVEIYYSSPTQVNAVIYIDTFFIDFHNYVVHFIDRDKFRVTWHLDDTQENYFKAMDGSWVLEGDGNITQVTYTNHLEFKGWIPSFMENYLLEKGLKKSTEWLRKD